MTNILSDLRRLTEAVHAAGADIAPTYREYVQLAFAIATDCGEAGRSDFLMLCSLSAKYDVHAANKLFSNALKTNNNSVHIGTAFHLAELCNVRPRPAEKPWQDTPTGTLGTPGAPYPAASHTHAHGYYNRAEMPAEEFPETPAASLPAEAADEETCRGSEPLTPLPCFDNRTLWPAPLNEITAHGTTRAQQDIMLLGAVTVLGASMNSHVRCAYGRCCLCTPASCFAAARNSCSLLSSAIYVLFSSDFQFLLCTSLSRYCRHWCCCRLWYTCGSRSMVIILCIIFRFRWQHI